MRARRKNFTEAELVTTKKSTTNVLVWLLTPPMETESLKLARPALEITNISADISVTVAWQLSENAEIWPDSTESPGTFDPTNTLAARTTEGISYGLQFEDISTLLSKKYVRFGVVVKNVSGSTLESCLAAIRLEFKKG